jgi:hypothetical protein
MSFEKRAGTPTVFGSSAMIVAKRVFRGDTN